MLTAVVEEVSQGKLEPQDRRGVPRDSHLAEYKLAVPCIELGPRHIISVEL